MIFNLFDSKMSHCYFACGRWTGREDHCILGDEGVKKPRGVLHCLLYGPVWVMAHSSKSRVV